MRTETAPLSDLEDGSLTASELASEFVHALIIHAGKAGVDAGDAAALAALDLIVRLAVYGRAPLKVVLDSIAAAATVRVKLVGLSAPSGTAASAWRHSQGASSVPE